MYSLLFFLLGSLIGYAAAKTYTLTQFKQEVQKATHELVTELDHLAKSIFAVVEANVHLIDQLQAAGKTEEADQLQTQTQQLLDSLLLDENHITQSQKLLDSVNLPTRRPFERNQRVSGYVTKLGEA